MCCVGRKHSVTCGSYSWAADAHLSGTGMIKGALLLKNVHEEYNQHYCDNYAWGQGVLEISLC